MIIFAVACALIIPLITMLFKNEVIWKPMDFVVAGVLVVGTGMLFEVILRKVKTTRNQIILALILIIILLLTWAELAFGIFGSPLAGS